MKALWLGRFQPPTIAHFVALVKILGIYHEVVIACVFDSQRPTGLDPKWHAMLDEEDVAAYRFGKNPFSSDEVLAMWNAVIETCQLESRVECCAVPRPQFFEFNRVFPAEWYQFVSTGGRNRVAQYEQMFGRPVRHIVPAFTLNNSEIRPLVQQTDRSWIDFIAPGAWRVFHSIDGESRCASAPRTP